MKGRSPTFTQLPLDIVGSTVFGRYPKISVEQTFNMIISDGFLVPYAGYLLFAAILSQGAGRGIFTSVRFGQLIAVINNQVYVVSTNGGFNLIGLLNSYVGPVYIDENTNQQIAISDNQNIYIYNYSTTNPGFTISTTSGFTPGYITYQNGRFITAALGTATWRLSSTDNSGNITWPNDSQHVGTFQTKPDNVVATQRFPGRGNLLFVMGNTVTELWQDVGGALFPYQRNTSQNIDYGCLSAETIAYNENIIVWLAANEKSGPMIVYSTGGDIQKISTDGIDFLFTQLTNPSNSFGFLFRQDGHLIYQITFPDDGLSYAYDFNTRKFFTLTDPYGNAHIARDVAFLNDQYYFVSYNDGNVYQTGTQFSTYNGFEIPWSRICKTVRLPDGSRFAINNLTFIIEMGAQKDIFYNLDLLTEAGLPIMTESGQDISVTQTVTQITTEPLEAEDQTILLTESGQELLIAFSHDVPFPIPQSVYLSMSKNGGQSFGSEWQKDCNTSGNFRNRLIYWNLGAANEFTPQLRFRGFSRFVVTDGVLSIYQ